MSETTKVAAHAVVDQPARRALQRGGIGDGHDFRAGGDAGEHSAQMGRQRRLAAGREFDLRAGLRLRVGLPCGVDVRRGDEGADQGEHAEEPDQGQAHQRAQAPADPA